MIGRWCYLHVSSIKTDMRVYNNCCNVLEEISELHFPHLSMLCNNWIQKNDYLLPESWDLSETDIILHAMSWSVCSEVPGLNTSHHCLCANLPLGTSSLQQCIDKYNTAVAIVCGGWWRERVVWKLSWRRVQATTVTWLLSHTSSLTHLERASM